MLAFFSSEPQRPRLKATIGACVDTAQCALLHGDEQTLPVQKKQRKVAKVTASLGAIPAVVTATCPAIQLADGKSVGQQQVTMKSLVGLREFLVVELDAHVQCYIKMVVSNTEAVHTYAPGGEAH